MGSDRFDDYVVQLGASGLRRNNSGAGGPVKGAAPRPARQGKQARRAKAAGHQKGASEPEPFPLSGFGAIEEDEASPFLGDHELDDEDAALVALLDQAAEGSSAESPQMEPSDSVAASGHVAITAMSLAAPPSCTTAQLLSDDDEDDDEEEEGSLEPCRSEQGVNTADNNTVASRVASAPPALVPASVTVGRASPSMVISNSSYDTAATLVSPSHVGSIPSSDAGTKRARETTLEDEMAQAWEDVDSDASDGETPLPGDATPTRPTTKARRSDIMVG